jgi:hypothetical protein
MAREFDQDAGVMKCNAVHDRIQTTTSPRRSASRSASWSVDCAVFRRLGDPNSKSRQWWRYAAARSRELGYRPVNKYPPPRRRMAPGADLAARCA